MSAPDLPVHDHLPLQDLVVAVDAALDGVDGHELLRVAGHPPELSRRPIRCGHPLDVLLGFTAPADWRALGVYSRGRARRLDRDDQPVDVVVAALLDRSGNGASLLREGSRSTTLDGAPGGTLGDACRRALGLPTADPPADTVGFWLRTWLDRLVDSIAFLGGADRFGSWDAVAALHPAATSPGQGAAGGPLALGDATRRLAEAWPWSRLRREPDVADTRHPPLPPDVASWMDDGMFARWSLAGLPDLAVLRRGLEGELTPPVVTAIAETTVAAGVPWPGH